MADSMITRKLLSSDSFFSKLLVSMQDCISSVGAAPAGYSWSHRLVEHNLATDEAPSQNHPLIPTLGCRYPQQGWVLEPNSNALVCWVPGEGRKESAELKCPKNMKKTSRRFRKGVWRPRHGEGKGKTLTESCERNIGLEGWWVERELMAATKGRKARS